MNTTETLQYDRLEANRSELQRAWKWFAGLGTLMLLGIFLAVDLTFAGAALLSVGLVLQSGRGVSRTASEALRAN